MTSRLGAYNTNQDPTYEQIKQQNDAILKKKLQNIESLNALQHNQNNSLSSINSSPVPIRQKVASLPPRHKKQIDSTQ